MNKKVIIGIIAVILVGFVFGFAYTSMKDIAKPAQTTIFFEQKYRMDLPNGNYNIAYFYDDGTVETTTFNSQGQKLSEEKFKQQYIYDGNEICNKDNNIVEYEVSRDGRTITNTENNQSYILIE